MCLKFKEEIINPSILVSLINDVFELFLFFSNIKREFCGVLDFFFFLNKIWKNKNSQRVVFDAKP
jgi:hypothetical protein